MTPQFQELLSRHAASSMLKQRRLGELLGERSWGVDLDRGEVTFGSDLSFPLQVLGTESQESGTWLWGWANEASNIPPALLQCASALREAGEREGIAEMAQPQFELGTADGHALSMVASGLCAASAYYRGPYDGGALFFALHEVPLPQGPASPIEAISTMNAVIMQYPLDHGVVARSFLSQQGFPLHEEEGALAASLPGGGEVRVRFDAQGRIAGMETTATPQNMAAASPEAAPQQETPAKKPWWKLGQ